MTTICLLRGNTLATKNRIAYALPIIQIMRIPTAKLPIQICLRLKFRERVGIIFTLKKTQLCSRFAAAKGSKPALLFERQTSKELSEF